MVREKNWLQRDTRWWKCSISWLSNLNKHLRAVHCIICKLYLKEEVKYQGRAPLGKGSVFRFNGKGWNPNKFFVCFFTRAPGGPNVPLLTLSSPHRHSPPPGSSISPSLTSLVGWASGSTSSCSSSSHRRKCSSGGRCVLDILSDLFAIGN